MTKEDLYKDYPREYEFTPKQMATMLMESIRDFSDEEELIKEEIVYVTETFEELMLSEKYNYIMHYFDRLFMGKEFTKWLDDYDR